MAHLGRYCREDDGIWTDAPWSFELGGSGSEGRRLLLDGAKSMKKSKELLKSSIIDGSGHAHVCHPSQLPDLHRRELLKTGVTLSAYLLASQVLNLGSVARAQASSYAPKRRLVWINMGGGWDILEVTDPKPNSTSGIDMSYEWGFAQSLAGSKSPDKIGRWLSRLALHGQDLLVVRGMVWERPPTRQVRSIWIPVS